MRRIIIDENQFASLFKRSRLITENRASKNQSLARKMVRELSPNTNDKEFTEKVLHDIPSVRKENFHLFPAAVRMILQADSDVNGDLIQKLNKYIGVVAPKAKELGLDQNANGMSTDEFFNMFNKDVNKETDLERQEAAKYFTGDNNFGGYDIVFIPDFETAHQYGDYVDWCITYDEGNYNQYTNNKTGYFYFFLKKGYQNITTDDVNENKAPLDEYGLSMIALSFRHDGSVNTVTCRWNNDNGGNDSVMTPEQLSKLIGTDIYSIFNPDDIQSLIPEGVEVLDDNLNYGLNLCQNKTTGNLYIYGYNFNDNVCFNSKNYVVYQGETDEGYEICALIDRNGLIHETAFGDEWIDTIENNGLLFVANTDEEEDGGGIYNAKTLEKLKEISIRELDNYQNILILTDDDGDKQVIDKKTNKVMFDESVDKCVYQYGRLVCYNNDNQISVINTDTCEIEIHWADIISKIGEGEQTLYLIQDKDGMFVVSEKFGLITNYPIEETFYVTPSKDVPEKCVYLIMYQNGGIALNQDKVFFSHVSLKDFEKVNEFTTLTPIDIREIFG